MIQEMRDLNFLESYNLINEYKIIHQEFYEKYLNIIESFDDDLIEKMNSAFNNKDLNTINKVQIKFSNQLTNLIDFLKKYISKLKEQDENLLNNINQVLSIFDFKKFKNEFNPYYNFIAEVLLLSDVYESTIDLITFSEYTIFNKIFVMPIIDKDIEDLTDNLMDIYEEFIIVLSKFLEDINLIYNNVYDIINKTDNRILSVTIESVHLISFIENSKDIIEDYFVSINKMVQSIPIFTPKKDYGLDLDYILVKDEIIRDFILRNTDWVYDYNELLYELEDLLTNYDENFINNNVGYDFIPKVINWVLNVNVSVLNYFNQIKDFDENINKFNQIKSEESNDFYVSIDLNKHLNDLSDLIEDIKDIEPFFNKFSHDKLFSA
jgi:hypothetical protein